MAALSPMRIKPPSMHRAATGRSSWLGVLGLQVGPKKFPSLRANSMISETARRLDSATKSCKDLYNMRRERKASQLLAPFAINVFLLSTLDHTQIAATLA